MTIGKTMKAALLFGAGDLRLEEIPTPRPGPDDVLVRIEACGVCGGDYHGYQRAKPRTNPTPAGHEAAGTIAEFGERAGRSGKEKLRVGDRVALSPGFWCGKCESCLNGRRRFCENTPKRDGSAGGGFSQYRVVRPSQCYPIPDSLPFASATMAEPVACCLYASGRAGITTGDRVAILGAGANALVFLQIALIRGAESVVVADTIESRLSVAESLGATRTVKAEYPDQALDSDGEYDVIIVTRGSPVFTETAVQYCAPRGRILCYGVSPSGVGASIETHELWRKEVSLIGSRSFDGTYGEAVDLISAGRIRVDSIVTSSVPLGGLASALADPPDGHIKAVTLPGATQES